MYKGRADGVRIAGPTNHPSATTSTATGTITQRVRRRAASHAAPKPAHTARHNVAGSQAREGTRMLCIPGTCMSNQYGPKRTFGPLESFGSFRIARAGAT